MTNFVRISRSDHNMNGGDQSTNGHFFKIPSGLRGVYSPFDSDENLVQEVKPVSLRLGKLCRNTQRRLECSDHTCPFAHDILQVMTHNSFYKTKPCFYYEKSYCTVGDKCTFIHGAEDPYFQLGRYRNVGYSGSNGMLQQGYGSAPFHRTSFAPVGSFDALNGPAFEYRVPEVNFHRDHESLNANLQLPTQSYVSTPIQMFSSQMDPRRHNSFGNMGNNVTHKTNALEMIKSSAQLHKAFPIEEIGTNSYKRGGEEEWASVRPFSESQPIEIQYPSERNTQASLTEMDSTSLRLSLEDIIPLLLADTRQKSWNCPQTTSNSNEYSSKRLEEQALRLIQERVINTQCISEHCGEGSINHRETTTCTNQSGINCFYPSDGMDNGVINYPASTHQSPHQCTPSDDMGHELLRQLALWAHKNASI